VPLLVALLVLGGAVAAVTMYSPIATATGNEDSEKVASDFVRNSPTFRFDGIEESFRLESSRSIKFCPGCYEYILYFESSHPGVGDRTGVKLRSHVTPHRAVLNLVDNTVVAMGVLDDSWDMGRQLIIDRE
jgi:hypothetical protein